MKKIFILILIIAISSIIFLFGNTLRCVSAVGPNCPELCQGRKINCGGEMAYTQRCKNGPNVCQSLSVDGYWQMIKNKLKIK